MRSLPCWILALVVLPAACGTARAQAGRYIPLPRLPGGGGFRFVPHLPFLGGDDGVTLVAVVALIGVVVVGWCVGCGLGQAVRGGPANPQPARAREAWGTPPFVSAPSPPTPDLIRSPDEVADKTARTTRLLEMLAARDTGFAPLALEDNIHDTFCRVQQCWQERDYGPVRDQLMPEILAKHEGLLRQMRANREINRIDDLHVRRLEFVHATCPAEPESPEVTALITFEARVYFIDERTGGFLRGDPWGTWYQEFWTFRRDGPGWRLRDIRQSRDGTPLTAPNAVAGLSDTELRNIERGVIVL